MVAHGQTKQGKTIIGLSGSSIALLYCTCGTEKCIKKTIVNDYFIFQQLPYRCYQQVETQHEKVDNIILLLSKINLLYVSNSFEEN